MILQSLYQLYERLAEDEDNGLPKPGYSLQNISFCVVIKSDGTLVEIQSKSQQTITTTKSGKEKITSRPLSLAVPGQSKPSGQGINPCLLWDNAAYMLGHKANDPKKSEAEQEKDKARTVISFEAFREKHLKLESEINDPDFTSVCRFLEQWDPASADEHQVLTELSSGFGVFQITGNIKYAHQSKGVRQWWSQENKAQPSPSDRFCLISGEIAPIALTHDPAIKGVAGAQSVGAKLVSFNEKAYESFGKEASRKVGQGHNAPVSETAAFAYCLKNNADSASVMRLLSSGPKQNLLPKASCLG